VFALRRVASESEMRNGLMASRHETGGLLAVPRTPAVCEPRRRLEWLENPTNFSRGSVNSLLTEAAYPYAVEQVGTGSDALLACQATTPSMRCIPKILPVYT
jgi:hypothetical protein